MSAPTLEEAIEYEASYRRAMEIAERNQRPITDLHLLRAIRPGHGVVAVRRDPSEIGRVVAYEDGECVAIRGDGKCRLLRAEELA